MGKDSYFADKVESMKVHDAMVLDQMEVQDLGTIIDKIVSAAESDRPDLRYFAPEHLLPLVKEAENAR